MRHEEPRPQDPIPRVGREPLREAPGSATGTTRPAPPYSLTVRTRQHSTRPSLPTEVTGPPVPSPRRLRLPPSSHRLRSPCRNRSRSRPQLSRSRTSPHPSPSSRSRRPRVGASPEAGRPCQDFPSPRARRKDRRASVADRRGRRGGCRRAAAGVGRPVEGPARHPGRREWLGHRPRYHWPRRPFRDQHQAPSEL